MNMLLSQPIISEVRRYNAPMHDHFHHHLEYELIYVISGTIEIEINKKLYRAGDDTLIFIASLDNHSVRQLTAEYDRCYIMFNTAVTDTFIRNPFLLNMLKNHTDDFQHCIDVSPIRDTVVDIFSKLLRCSDGDLLNNELVACYLNELLIRVCRLRPQQFAYDANPWKSRILSIQTYIDSHYREKLRISDLCQQFFISNSCLSHQFTELTGYSPKQYLTMVRLKNAAIEIHNTDRSINEICIGCGFSDLNNFNRQFKRFYGCTPGQFRPVRTQTGGIDL